MRVSGARAWTTSTRVRRTEESSEQEALNLDPLAAELLNCEDGDVVSGHETESSDDDVADTDLEELVPGSTSLAVEANLLEYDVLVQVDTVEAASTL